MEENIFDISKNKSKPKKEKSFVIKQKPIASSDNLIQDAAVTEMLKKMHEMKNDLENQMTSIYQQGKTSRISGVLLAENTNDLTIQQLKQLQEQEQILMDQIRAAIPPESCLRKNPKSKEKLTQERQSKMRGARNKWIPVR